MNKTGQRLAREVAREQRDRVQRDGERIGEHRDDELRHKDARDNALASDLPRARPRL